MMYEWLLIAILAYLFFGIGSFGDKLVLAGKTRGALHPKAYTFYVGLFGVVTLFLIPFANFGLPSSTGLFWIILDALVRILGIYTMFVALEKYDVSRVMATIGATQPIFIFVLTWVFWGPQAITGMDILAFILLLVGSFIISIKKSTKATESYLFITLISSVMFSLDYIFAKFVFLNQPFLQGIIWISIFIFLFVLLLVIRKKSRKEIFVQQAVSNGKTKFSFLLAQGGGGIANLLQSFAISLAPVGFLAIINSLRGVQYVFLFVITLLASLFYPKILKEELSLGIIIQKVVSIIFIVTGLAILVTY